MGINPPLPLRWIRFNGHQRSNGVFIQGHPSRFIVLCIIGRNRALNPRSSLSNILAMGQSSLVISFRSGREVIPTSFEHGDGEFLIAFFPDFFPV